MRKLIPSKEELERLYLNEHCSYKRLGNFYSVTPSTVGNWIKTYKIQPRRFGEGRIAKGSNKPSKYELESLYVKDKISVNKLSKIFGVDKRTIHKLIIKYGLNYRGIGPRKIPHNFIRPSREVLNDLYNKDKLNLKEIGIKFNVDPITVRRWFDKAGLVVRSIQEGRLIKKNSILPSREQLINDYEILSIELIARKYKLSTESVLTLLNKYQIKKRGWSEARKLALKMGRVIPWNKGKGMDEPKIAKMMQHLHEKQMEKKETIRIKQSAYWKKKFLENPELREKMRRLAMGAKPKYKNTEPEKLMKKLLEDNGLNEGLVEQYPVRIKNFITKPDFAYPTHKLAIYCDGEFWHGGFHHLGKSFNELKEGPRKEAIRKRIKIDEQTHYIMWGNGWAVLRFWQHEIENNPKEVVSKIRKNLFDKDFIRVREEERKKVFEWGFLE